MKKHKNVKSIFSYLYNRTVIVGIFHLYSGCGVGDNAGTI